MYFTVATRAFNADKHTGDIKTLLFHKGKLYSGGEDGEIKVWNENLKLLGSVTAHNGIVYSLAANDDTLYSCSNDGTVKSWTLEDLKPKDTILEDQTEFWKLYFTDNALFVGTSDGTVKLFVKDKFRSSVNVIDPVSDMVVLDDLIYVVRDFDVVIQELYPGTKTGFGLKKVVMGRHPLCLIGDKLCCASRNGKDIMVYESTPDFQFLKYTEVKNAHEVAIDALCTVQNYGSTMIYTGGPEKILKQWKMVDKKIMGQSSSPVEVPITSIAIGVKGNVYIGGQGGDVFCINIQ